MFYCAGDVECVVPMLEEFTERRNFVGIGLNAMKGIECGDIQGAFYAFADASEAITRLHKDGIIDKAIDLSFCAHLLEKADSECVGVITCPSPQKQKSSLISSALSSKN